MTKHVLLVEDDRVSRESLAYLLRGLGHIVRAVPSSEGARIALRDFTPDVALLDVRLPGMPGDALAIELRREYPRMKIVLVSAEFRLDAPERFGPEIDFIPKPLDFDRLLSVIQG